jgi:hypothetical protein
VTDVRQDRFVEVGQEWPAKGFSRSDQRRYKVTRLPEAEVVRAEVTLERGAVADLAPWQATTASTQRIYAAAHEPFEHWILV